MTSKIREPYNHESDECVRLIFISGPHLLSYFYIEKEPKIYDVFKTFFKKNNTTFSRENILVEEENNKIRGLIIAHPINNLTKFLINELKCIKKMKSSLFSFLKALFKIFYRVKLVI